MSTTTDGARERDMLDRLLVRSPALAGLMARGARRLRPGSPIRRQIVSLQVKRGFDAMARSDVEMVLLNYEPDAEVWMKSMAGVGISDCYHGHDGIRALYADVDEAFERWWWTVRGIADGGDRIAVRGDFVGYGRISGVKTDLRDGATALKYSERGLIVWQEWFAEQDGWRKALEAIGLTA